MSLHTTHANHPLPKIIGWREVVDFPDWGAHGLLAKSDTGAKGSAIDVESHELMDDGHVRFWIASSRTDRTKLLEVVAPVVGRVKVRSSNGRTQTRIKVRTRLQIGRVFKTVELSLVNRQRMLCRVLLGREALAGTFLVDSSEKFVHGPKRRAAFRAKLPAKGKRRNDV